MTRRWKFLLTGLVAALIVPLGAGPALADPLPDTITVSASGKVDVDPDVGIVVLGVRSRALSAQTATSRLSAHLRKVVGALKGAGFTNDELSTEDIQLFRRCFRDCRDHNLKDDFKPKPVYGYVGEAGVRTRTHALKRLGEIIDLGIAAGASGVRSVSFDVEDKTAAVLDALKEAMGVARGKAEVLAQEAGRTLGEAIIILEGRTTQPQRFAYASFAFTSSGGSGSASDLPFLVNPPTLSASGQIEVTFRLQ
ncbi:MAG: uncharacterized protein QOH90_1179 [Actinomycetota bacterium]|jgi:uncharacterized protein YggE|nr:uncharacterized protein [Actinomycetota bacterium]